MEAILGPVLPFIRSFPPNNLAPYGNHGQRVLDSRVRVLSLLRNLVAGPGLIPALSARTRPPPRPDFKIV